MPDDWDEARPVRSRVEVRPGIHFGDDLTVFVGDGQVHKLIGTAISIEWERMERKARQEDVPLAANTLAASCGRVIDLFDPIVRHVFKRCMESEYVALDATSIRVLDVEHPLGIRNGALWLIQGAHCYSYFMYAKSGHADHLEAKLEGYRLVSAMCDGSPTNNCVERAGAKRGGCHAHARRGLVGALRGGDHRASRGSADLRQALPRRCGIEACW